MRRHERRDAAVSGVEALSAVHFGVVHLWTALDETWGAKRSTGGELRWERPEVGDGDAGKPGDGEDAGRTASGSLDLGRGRRAGEIRERAGAVRDG